MSRKNITDIQEINPNLIRATFKAADGERVYEYRGASARAFKRGSEPSRLMGRLIEHRKEK